jgi:hypothetical protein
MEIIKNIWWKEFSFKKLCRALCKRVVDYYIYREGGKPRLNIETLLVSGSFIMCPLLILYFLSSGENASYIGRSPNSLATQKSPSMVHHSQNPNSYDYPVQQNTNVVGGGNTASQSRSQANHHAAIKLGAKQVLVREESSLGYGFHAGTNLIGELQSTIDTRDPAQVVRVILPYGGRSRDGSSEIPKGTLLLGQVNYQGKGEKVFIQFQQAILPGGKSIKIAAQALDPKDYSTGLGGEIQSQAKSRALSMMGLSALAAMGNVMTEKVSMGEYQVEAKANAKNALLAGVSRAAEVEASRLQEQSDAQDYVQVEAGTAVVVSLTQGLSL